MIISQELYAEMQGYARDSGRYLAVKDFVKPASEILNREHQVSITPTGEVEIKVTLSIEELQHWNHALAAMKGLCK